MHGGYLQLDTRFDVGGDETGLFLLGGVVTLFDGERARIEQHAGAGARWVSITREESLRYCTNALQVDARVLVPRPDTETLVELIRSLADDGAAEL